MQAEVRSYITGQPSERRLFASRRSSPSCRSSSQSIAAWKPSSPVSPGPGSSASVLSAARPNRERATANLDPGRITLLTTIAMTRSLSGDRFALSPYREPSKADIILQGDGWREFQIFKFHTGERSSVRGLVISNSCDVDPDNQRDIPARIIFAPLAQTRGLRGCATLQSDR